jgi:hypothetical protein
MSAPRNLPRLLHTTSRESLKEQELQVKTAFGLKGNDAGAIGFIMVKEMAAENNAVQVIVANKREQGTKRKEIQVAAEVTKCATLHTQDTQEEGAGTHSSSS